jgi:hypothetical protein
MLLLTVQCAVTNHRGQRTIRVNGRKVRAFGAYSPQDGRPTLTLVDGPSAGQTIDAGAGAGYHALRCAPFAAAIGAPIPAAGAAPVAASDFGVALAAAMVKVDPTARRR